MAGRRRNRLKAGKIKVTTNEVIDQYVADIVALAIYGNTPPEVARTLLLKGIEDLITRRILERRPPTNDGEKS